MWMRYSENLKHFSLSFLSPFHCVFSFYVGKSLLPLSPIDHVVNSRYLWRHYSCSIFHRWSTNSRSFWIANKRKSHWTSHRIQSFIRSISICPASMRHRPYDRWHFHFTIILSHCMWIVWNRRNWTSASDWVNCICKWTIPLWNCFANESIHCTSIRVFKVPSDVPTANEECTNMETSVSRETNYQPIKVSPSIPSDQQPHSM